MGGKMISRIWLLALSILAAAPVAGAKTQPMPIHAEFATPTDRYPHNIMGNLPAHTDLVVTLQACAGCPNRPATLTARLPDPLVFEDLAPRLADLNRDGVPEIIVVESHQQRGSRLAVWEVALHQGRPELRRGATTDFIGTRFRWLAPIGAADLDGDGRVDIAYVEKPHLDKVLRIVRREGARLRPVASMRGVTNHAIGQETIQGRIALCDGRPTIIALNATGDRVLAIRLADGKLTAKPVAAPRQPDQLDPVPACGN